jgi:hypothetical protein
MSLSISQVTGGMASNAAMEIRNTSASGGEPVASSGVDGHRRPRL